MSPKRMFWVERAERLFCSIVVLYGLLWALEGPLQQARVICGLSRGPGRVWMAVSDAIYPPECNIHVIYKIFAMQFNLLMEYVQAVPSLPDYGFLAL